MILNKETGESVLDNTDYHFVFTGEALVWAERQLGVGTLELISKAVEGLIGLNDVQVLLGCGIEAHRRRNGGNGKAFNLAKAPKVLLEAGGLMKVLPQVVESVVASPALGLSGDEEDENEDDAAPFDGPTSSDEQSPPE